MKTKVLEIVRSTLSAAEDNLYRADVEFGILAEDIIKWYNNKKGFNNEQRNV